MLISEMNIADDLIPIRSYEHLTSFKGRIVDIVIIDRRDNQVKQRVHRNQWVYVVENPEARFHGVILTNAPQSVKVNVRISPTADFELNTMHVILKG